MKKSLKWPLFLVCGLVMAGSFTSCDDDDDNNVNIPSQKDEMINKALIPYVDKTVILTYKQMADEAILLSNVCNDMLLAGEHNVTLEQVKEAGEHWKNSRKYWEQSEAFLFGAAADYNIDPHIDSWPLDKNAMDALLERLKDPNYEWNIENNAGYGLLGFHAVEYLLFELDDTELKSLPHNVNYTLPELRYLSTVAEDLRNQCVRLEAAWAGMGNITSEKQTILTEAELEPTINYGWSMKNAGKAGSLYKTFQAAAEDLIQGCADIADEVGSTKIGTPYIGTNEEDKNYIESPYSLNSITDFVDNIISIKNAYEGYELGDASISDYIKTTNSDLDEKMRKQIDLTIKTIGQIPEPFVKHAKDNITGQAVEECDKLVNLLAEVAGELTNL